MRRRLTQSCDRCKAKKRRCDGAHPCSNCNKARALCTKLIEQKKRGPKKGSVCHLSIDTREIPASSVDQTSSLLDLPSTVCNDISDLQQQSSHDDSLLSATSPLTGGLFAPLDDSAGASMPLTPLSTITTPINGIDFFSLSVVSEPTAAPAKESGKLFDALGISMDDWSSPAHMQSYSAPSTTASASVAPTYPWAPLKPSKEWAMPFAMPFDKPLSTPPVPKMLPLNLSNPLLPTLPTDFYLHLVSLFFTYFHPTFPVLHEASFLERLIPINMHSNALLNIIYAIGVNYSKHPGLDEAGRNTARIFIETAEEELSKVERNPRAGKVGDDTQQFDDCIAQMLLDIWKFGCARHRGGDWDYLPQSYRMVQKLRLPYKAPSEDIYTLFNGRTPLACIRGNEKERKKAWFGIFVLDTMAAFTTGWDPLIDENRYLDTLADTETLSISSPPALAVERAALGMKTDAAPEPQLAPSSTRWHAFMTGFPGSTLFGPASDFTSIQYLRSSIGKYQVDHLLSPAGDTVHLVQLCIILRKIMRLTRQPNHTPIEAIHNELLNWKNALPYHMKVLDRLGVPAQYSVVGKSRCAPMTVKTSLLFLASISLLHRNGIHSAQPVYLLDSSNKSSLEICLWAYEHQQRLLRHIYSSCSSASPGELQAPPSELVSTPFIQSILLLPAVTLLSTEYADQLVGNHPIPDIESVEDVLLPVLDDLSRVWSRASEYGACLRGLVEVVRERGNPDAAAGSPEGCAVAADQMEEESADDLSEILRAAIKTAMKRTNIGSRATGIRWDM